MKVKLTWTISTTPANQAPTTFRIFYWPKGTAVPASPNTTVNTATVCTGTSCTYSIDNLLDNVAYDFRIDTTCANGDPAPSQVLTLQNMVCPTFTPTATNNSVSYSFTGAVNGTVSGYKVELLLASNNSVVEDEGILPPAATISGTFGTVLTASTAYIVRVTVKSNFGIADKVCTYNITTTSTPSCNAVTNLAGCICGVDCAQACS